MNYQEQFTLCLDYLKTKYKKLMLSKKELAQELGISESTINLYISKNTNLPDYKKMAVGKNTRVMFPLINVAQFLTEDIVRVS